jgi:UDP-N-acetylglucosamine 2-epimerase (non-hydrolysing)
VPARQPVIHLVAAARPNFMKIAPLYHELRRRTSSSVVLVHTGQHYDAGMSSAFFSDLRLPLPDVHLGVGSGTHAEQTGGVMIAYEKVLEGKRPDFVIVAGDVNSTLACALTATKMHIRVGHLEAGLRSRDRSMPEEINRLLTDAVADVLWTPSRDADRNLRAEGIPPDRIVCVGNIMLDSFEMLRDKIESREAWAKASLSPGSYGVVTLHRPANVDRKRDLEPILKSLVRLASKIRLIFPVHPRTRARIREFGLEPILEKNRDIQVLEPMGYIKFMSFVLKSRLVITDSGGVQEETTYLDIPCLTIRTTTERPITVTQGTNKLVEASQLVGCFEKIMAGDWPRSSRPEMWDGHTAPRVVESLRSFL